MLSIPFPPHSAQGPAADSSSASPFPQKQARAGTPDNPLLVVVSLDVEEEGLFSGQYASTGCTVRNVALLRRLEPLSRELGFPLTLLCAHTVFTDSASRGVLEYMRDHAGAEIGAHLHHWSTASDGPPVEGGNTMVETCFVRGKCTVADGGGGEPLRTHRMPRELLREKLRALLDVGRDFQGAPLTSFRMGRWDLRASVRPLLAEEGIWVDSSVCPLRAFGAGQGKGAEEFVSLGPDHFLAPADPYWVKMPPEAVAKTLLEVPITQVPWHPWLARMWYKCWRGRPALDDFRFWGALSPNPVWHNAQVMRMATRVHVARGGRVLSLFWHSSEMLPGASPHIPHQAAADALLEKVRIFLIWLRNTYTVRGVTLSELHGETGFPILRDGMPHNEGDW